MVRPTSLQGTERPPVLTGTDGYAEPLEAAKTLLDGCTARLHAGVGTGHGHSGIAIKPRDLAILPHFKNRYLLILLFCFSH